MGEYIKAVHRKCYGNKEKCSVERFGPEHAKVIQKYHESFPEYEMTPLADLKKLAENLGVSSLKVKDESYRFGLNAFKALGGSYCVGRYIAEQLNMDMAGISFEKLASNEVRNELGEITFVTATDGNHGRGIAWIANRLGHKSVVYMPKGSALERLNNIRALGADAGITDMNYDEAVRYASRQAKKEGWVFVQDTAWDGYEKIPGWIMEGYTTMACEVCTQLKGEKPTHIFLQAGVGAMAGAITGFFADLYRGDDKPIITIVEPNKADCNYRTAWADDGTIHIVDGDMNTIMAGLACGEPCAIGWNVLKDYADNFLSVPDYIAAKGMRVLGNPLGDDPRVISGESGAVTVGLVAEILQSPGLEWLKNMLKLDENSKILCFSTEGATDRENYQRIVWDGLNPSF